MCRLKEIQARLKGKAGLILIIWLTLAFVGDEFFALLFLGPEAKSFSMDSTGWWIYQAVVLVIFSSLFLPALLASNGEE